MNILITQHRLKQRGGTEMYVFDLARKLIQKGHRPIVYCPQIGGLEHEFRLATIPVIDDLRRVQIQPDIIHGQHSIETVTAMLRFPETPAVYVLHDWAWAYDKPPLLDRVIKYVAVDETCYDRLVLREGVPAERAMIIQNAVDLDRFCRRPELPPLPKQALVFSNYVDHSAIGPIRTACKSLGIEVKIAGAKAGTISNQPELELQRKDIVFAKGRCAREALAVGCSVMVSDAQGGGGLVTSTNVEQYSRLNFGRRLLHHQQTPEYILREIKKYDPVDAKNVSNYVREKFGLNDLVERLLEVYEDAIRSHRKQHARNGSREYLQLAEYLRNWSQELASQDLNIQQHSNRPQMNIRRAA